MNKFKHINLKLVQQDDFEEKWLNAENTHYLRDMLLLSKRLRFLRGKK